MIGLSTTSISMLTQSGYFVASHLLPLFVVRFVDRDMVVRYHWGHGVGHTYAFGVMGPDVMEAPEVEEQENDVSRQEVGLSGDVEDGLDDRSLGDDDMVYQNDSDEGMSGEDADD
jgi:hypothetical protein